MSGTLRIDRQFFLKKSTLVSSIQDYRVVLRLLCYSQKCIYQARGVKDIVNSKRFASARIYSYSLLECPKIGVTSLTNEIRIRKSHNPIIYIAI